uniref:Uncharacterized protein n=1 Tax=Vespula pensylvanica TaxID=30213 RepID=A0A834NYC2_VESPE|nr:hypothetical protein H0235_009226 [Vespula pensylvanica]
MLRARLRVPSSDSMRDIARLRSRAITFLDSCRCPEKSMKPETNRRSGSPVGTTLRLKVITQCPESRIVASNLKVLPLRDLSPASFCPRMTNAFKLEMEYRFERSCIMLLSADTEREPLVSKAEITNNDTPLMYGLVDF